MADHTQESRGLKYFRIPSAAIRLLGSALSALQQTTLALMDLPRQQPAQGPLQLKNGDSEVGCKSGCHSSLRKSTTSRFLSTGSPATATGTTIYEDRNRGKYRQPLNSASTSCCPCQQGGVAVTTPEQTVPWLVPTHRKLHSRKTENP